MPCYDSRTEPAYVAAEVRKQMQPRLDAATRAACEALTLLDELSEQFNRKIRLSPQTRAWWEEHQELDRRRKRA